MGLETATFINGLVATNPVGATDPKSAGDDHLRLIKATILATFAAITGAVTATHTQLNYLASATGTTGTASSNVVFSASPTLTGTVTAGTINASSIGTTPLPAANLTGSIADARLSANVPLLNAANVFTANQGIQVAGSTALAIKSTTTAPASVQLYTNSTIRGYMGSAGASDDLVTGSVLGDTVLRSEAGSLLFTRDAGSSIALTLSSSIAKFAKPISVNAVGFVRSDTTSNVLSIQGGSSGIEFNNNANNAARLTISDAGVFDFKGGPFTALGNAANEVGNLCTPKVAVTSTGTTALDKALHAGKQLYVTGAGAAIRLDATFDGFNCVIINNTGGTITLTENSTSVYLAGGGFGSHGTRTVQYSGVAYVQTLGGSTAYIVSGVGVS